MVVKATSQLASLFEVGAMYHLELTGCPQTGLTYICSHMQPNLKFHHVSPKGTLLDFCPKIQDMSKVPLGELCALGPPHSDGLAPCLGMDRKPENRGEPPMRLARFGVNMQYQAF